MNELWSSSAKRSPSGKKPVTACVLIPFTAVVRKQVRLCHYKFRMRPGVQTLGLLFCISPGSKPIVIHVIMWSSCFFRECNKRPVYIHLTTAGLNASITLTYLCAVFQPLLRRGNREHGSGLFLSAKGTPIFNVLALHALRTQ